MPERAGGSTPSTDAGSGEVSAAGMLRVTATRPAAQDGPGSGGEPLLVLTSPGGQVFHLPVDGSLRAAVRNATASPAAPSADGEAPPLRPKDIQARIRGGESAAEVAEAAGVSVGAVDRYAGPVLAERSHVATVARATVVRSARSRPSLEDLVRHRLASRGVALGSVAWDAWRRGEAGWVLQVGFRAGTRDRVAQWRYDPVAELVDPLDDEARWLSASHEAESPGAGASSRRLSSVRVFDVESEGGLEGDTGPLPPVDQDDASRPGGRAVDTDGRDGEEAWEGPDHDEVAARTMDLLDALSDRRGRRQPMVDLEDDLDDGEEEDREGTSPAPPPEDEDDEVGPGYGSGFPAHLRPTSGRGVRGATHLRAVAPPAGGATATPGPATADPAAAPAGRRAGRGQNAADPAGPVQGAGGSVREGAAEPARRGGPARAHPGGDEPSAAPGREPALPGGPPVPGAPVGPDRQAGPGRRTAAGRQEVGPAPAGRPAPDETHDESSSTADVPTTGSIGRWVGPASPTALPATAAPPTASVPLATAPGEGVRTAPAGAGASAGAGAGVDEEDGEAARDEPPARSPRSAGTRSRAGRRSSVPSWDEIVFGSAPEDPPQR